MFFSWSNVRISTSYEDRARSRLVLSKSFVLSKAIKLHWSKPDIENFWKQSFLYLCQATSKVSKKFCRSLSENNPDNWRAKEWIAPIMKSHWSAKYNGLFGTPWMINFPLSVAGWIVQAQKYRSVVSIGSFLINQTRRYPVPMSYLSSKKCRHNKSRKRLRSIML